MSSQGVERELKFADVDHGDVRERLKALEAERQGPPAFEDNWIFDAGDVLNDQGSLLRLRIEKQRALLTYKGAVTYEGRVKVRKEIETLVGDVANTRAILEALGYKAIYRYQKYREEWFLGSIVIALDHTPIGDFVEFEGVGCERVAKRSGFDIETAERRNYRRLWADYRKQNPDAPREMIFKE